MKPVTRLALYAAGMAVAFGGAFGLAGATVPDGFVAQWKHESTMNKHSDAHEEKGPATAPIAPSGLKGLAVGAAGYVLSPVSAPESVGARGRLSFRIQDTSGQPVTSFATAHGKELHLIVVRSDGTQFRHVHPVLDRSTGTWSVPWEWAAAGTYSVFADFTAAGAMPAALTLKRTVEVGGQLTPVAAQPSRVDEVDGYTAEIEGDLVPGSSSKLTITLKRNGRPVTTLQPYLGAFGHLVALRQGDLAYLHVHADGADPEPGDTAGPSVSFMAAVPTAGRYLLYLDFQVEGQVRTAEFVLDAAPAAHAEMADAPTATNGSHPAH